MKNSFDVEVCFKDYPVQFYEWDSVVNIFGVKLSRVSTNFLRSVLTYQGAIENAKSKFVLLSDTKEAVALKLSDDGKILKRSFLTYSKALDVSEFAFNLKEANLEFKKSDKKLEYPPIHSIEEEIKDYIANRIKMSRDEDFRKYIWYLYSDEVDGYTSEKLLTRVNLAPLDVNMKLYKFLIES